MCAGLQYFDLRDAKLPACHLEETILSHNRRYNRLRRDGFFFEQHRAAMQAKRHLPDSPDDEQEQAAKRPRLVNQRCLKPSRAGPDHLSLLSDELLIRILSSLPLHHLLFSVAPVSRRFYRLAGDSQLWKALYYSRFVLPRAMRIPGFREDPNARGKGMGQRGGKGHKLHYSGRRRLWADGRHGGVIRDKAILGNRLGLDGYGEEEEQTDERQSDIVNWKRQYKIRHNWARGKCAVEELRIAEGDAGLGHKVLVKVVEGVAITADASLGLRAWDLKTRATLAQVSFGDEGQRGEADRTPTCIAIDEADSTDSCVSMAVGFLNGSFGVWRLDVSRRLFERRYRHEKSSNGALIGMALSYPYLLTATRSVLISLYTFDVPSKNIARNERADGARPCQSPMGQVLLGSPYLLTSLKSHSSRAPLALSIRSTATTTIASIAYTFSTRNGWCIGMQDLHIKPNSTKASWCAPEITTTRLAYTASVDFGSCSSSPQQSVTPRSRHRDNESLGLLPENATDDWSSASGSPSSPAVSDSEPGPTTLCYTHPYLLAALPDNTLILHLVTSTAKALTLSPGIRLWGHTSGISDAEITARGKAVSVSERGDEMRVWELEGGPGPRGIAGTGIGTGRSVEIRAESSNATRQGSEWDERRNWVGFDDEMVIVLKEGIHGGESLMVYDFT